MRERATIVTLNENAHTVLFQENLAWHYYSLMIPGIVNYMVKIPNVDISQLKVPSLTRC